MRSMASAAVITALMGLVLVGCGGPEDEVVTAENTACKSLGTMHRTSRDQLERMRIREMVTIPEYECLITALQKLDEQLTDECKETPLIGVQATKARKLVDYEACLVEDRKFLAKKAVSMRMTNR